jgi:hypothetical protein
LSAFARISKREIRGVRFGVEVQLSFSDYTHQPTIVPAAFSHEYELLKEVCANMRSGFLLLNQREEIAYANQSAYRLLRLDEVGEQTQAFDFCARLTALATHPGEAGSELERLWRADAEERTIDLALADAAVRWLRVRCFPCA